VAATAWTGDVAGGLWSRFGYDKVKAAGHFDQGADTIKRDGTVGIHKSVVTDFHEAGGQHVLQEAPNELHDLKGKDS